MLPLLLAALFLIAPAPAAAPRELCRAPLRTPERYCTMLFFEPGSAEVAPTAWPILDTVVSEVEDNAGARVVLAGYADAALAPAAARALSLRMAESTRDYLVQHGVDAKAITVEAYGSANPRYPTAQGVAETQNRRVEVWVIY